MSYTIIYNRCFIKVDENIFIPVTLAGCNNLFEARCRKRVRSWENMNYFSKGIFATREQLEQHYESERAEIIRHNKETIKECPNWDVYSDDRFGYFSSLTFYGKGMRATTFGMYKSFLTNGMKEARTVEELAELDIRVIVKKGCDYDHEVEQSFFASVKSTEELLTAIEECEKIVTGTTVNTVITISASENAIKRLKKRRVVKEKKLVMAEKYFVIQLVGYGFLIKRTARQWRYAYTTLTARKFPTEKAAQRRADKLKGGSMTLEVVEVKAPTAMYV